MSCFENHWRPPPETLHLSAGEVHVWCVPLEAPAGEIEAWSQTLSPDERQRAARFRFDRHRMRFVVRHGVLRAILARYLEVPAERLEFSVGQHGKPMLKQTGRCEAIHFNSSHSGNLALIALSVDRPLGVDVERIRPLTDLQAMLKRCFSPEDQATIRALPPAQQWLGFFNGFSRKEALLKALGTGLSVPLDRVGVSLLPDEPARVLSIDMAGQQPDAWQLACVAPNAEHAAALACQGREPRIARWLWA